MSLTQLAKNIIKLPFELSAAQFGQHNTKTNEPLLWVIMYHRILPIDDVRYNEEEPGMIVEPETFRQHLKILQNQFELVFLSDWVERYKKGLPLPPKSCAITFDDGWLDNYQYALPIIEECAAPTSLFAVADLIGTNQEFWPNRLAKILQQPATQRQQSDWLTQFSSTQSFNKEQCAQAIYNLKTYSDDYLLQHIEQAEKDLQLNAANSPCLMNWEQIAHLANHDLFEIGSHTSHHFRLKPELDVNIMKKEIVQSKKLLEQQLAQPVKLFCYPNGDHYPQAVDLVSQHYLAAVTTQSGFNRQSDLTHNNALFTLKRHGVHQHSSDNKRRLLSRLAR